MSCFKCSKCGCVENTAVSRYWVRPKGSALLCSECDPATGEWHGVFEKRPATGLKLASDGFLYSVQDVESESFKWREKHQGLTVVGDA